MMDDNFRESPDARENQSDASKLIYVMLVVLIICGGNGAGILAAALVWKFTHLLSAAILSVVGITALAFLGGMLVILSHNKRQK